MNEMKAHPLKSLKLLQVKKSNIPGKKGVAASKAKAKAKVVPDAPQILPLCELPDELTKGMSSKLFSVNDSFGAALDSKIEGWIVKTTSGNTTKGAEYEKRLSKYSTHDFMVSMPWREAGQEATQVAEALISMKAEIKTWKVPLNVADLRVRFDGLCKQYDEAMSGLDDFLSSADRLEASDTKLEKKDKDLVNSVVNKFYAQLTRDEVPKAIAKVGGDLNCFRLLWRLKVFLVVCYFV